MNSISREIDDRIIAAQVRMERQNHLGSFLLLEGIRDIRRFRAFVDEIECSMVNCAGRPNVVGAVTRLTQDGFLGVLGMVDADFSHLEGQVPGENIVFSDYHDLDVDIFCSSALDRYLSEVGDPIKVARFRTTDELREALFKSLKRLSALRYANEKHQLGYSLKNLPLQDLHTGDEIDLEGLIACVSEGRFSSTRHKNALRRNILHHERLEVDLRQFTNGHDVAAALGVMLKHRLGARKPAQCFGSEVEMHLRLAFNAEDFRGTGVFEGIRAWEEVNRPYVVLGPWAR
jgi:hypothetical protein